MIEVSVYCITYNHEKYIRKTLEGIMMQKTTFDFEVIVHDDASTDRTADIIKEFADKYPKKIIPVLQVENQRSKGISIIKNHILPKINGTYVAACEGDDYWTDPEKLQKQYDMLKAHPECDLCLHKVRIIRENGEKTTGTFPRDNLCTGVHSNRVLLAYIANDFFQLTSYFMRSDAKKEYEYNRPHFSIGAKVGDIPLLLWLGSTGKSFAYINQEMSCYRVNSLGSWNSRLVSDEVRIRAQEKSMIELIHRFNEDTNYMYADICKQFEEQEIFHSCVKRNAIREMLSTNFGRKRFVKLTSKQKLRIILCYIKKNLFNSRQK